MTKKKKIILIAAIALAVIIAIVAIVLIIKHKKKPSAPVPEGLYEEHVYDPIGESSGYPLTPKDTRDGLVSFWISGGAGFNWVIEHTDYVYYYYSEYDNDAEITIGKVEKNLEEESGASNKSQVTIYSNLLGVKYSLEVELKDEDRLCYSTGKCDVDKKPIASLVDEKYKSAVEALKIPSGAVVCNTSDYVVGDSKGDYSASMLYVGIKLTDGYDFICVTKDTTAAELCEVLEKTELQKTTYEKSTASVAGVNVVYYKDTQTIASVWSDKDLTYLYLTGVEEDIKGAASRIEAFVSGEKVQ